MLDEILKIKFLDGRMIRYTQLIKHSYDKDFVKIYYLDGCNKHCIDVYPIATILSITISQK